MSIARRACRKVALSLVALFAAAPALSQAPQLYSRGQIDGLTSAGPDLFWKAGCGDDFSPELSYVRTIPAAGTAGFGALQRILFQPLACGPERVASRNIAVDGRHVYWITADRRLVRVARNAFRATPETVAPVARATDAGYVLTAADGWIAWSDGSGIFRIRAPGDRVDTVLAPGRLTGMRDLVASGDGYVVRSGDRLFRLVPAGGDPQRFSVVELGNSVQVTAFAVQGDRIYLAAPRGGGSYAIASITRDGVHTTYHTSPAIRPDDWVDHIAVAGETLYWHVTSRGGGPIMRMRIGDRPVRLTADLRLSSESPVIGAGGYLYWTTNEGLMRLYTGTPALAAPAGDIWITGIEWVQVVQTPSNEVPMIAGKTTAVRVYVQSREDVNGPWTNVQANLQVEGSLRPHILGPIVVSPAGGDRRRLESSFLFVLSPEETQAGPRRMAVTLTAGDFRTESDTANNRRDFVINFAPRIDLRLYVFTWTSTNNATCGQGPHPPPADGAITSPADVERDRRLAQAILPISSLTTSRLAASGRSFDNATCGAYLTANDFLKEELDRLFESGSVLAASITPPSDPQHEHGWCCEPSQRGHQTLRLNNPGRATYTMAHELIHRFYRTDHPWDAGFGYPTARRPAQATALAPIGDVVGIDFAGGQPTLVLGQDAAGRSLRNDLMSYARPDWISLFTYCRALRGMSGGRTVCPAGVEGGGP